MINYKTLPSATKLKNSFYIITNTNRARYATVSDYEL